MPASTLDEGGRGRIGLRPRLARREIALDFAFLSPHAVIATGAKKKSQLPVE
jgi:hypothetical protein